MLIELSLQVTPEKVTAIAAVQDTPFLKRSSRINARYSPIHDILNIDYKIYSFEFEH